MGPAAALRHVADTWTPEPVETVDAVSPWAVDALAGVLDVPPVAGPVPPLWHWLAFRDTTPQSGLGADGHPRQGPFLPPLPDRRRMIGGGRLRVLTGWPVGEPVTRRSSVVGSEPKHGRGGDLLLVTVRHEFAYDGVPLAVEEQDVVYRSQPAGQPRRTPEPAGTPPPEPEWSIDLYTDAALLFRISALTYNTHRIHYDLPYATGTEGYPGLVVHGPLLALLLLELPRRFQPAETVTGFDYRLTRPVYAGATVRAGAQRTADGLTVWAGEPGQPAAVTGRITLAPARPGPPAGPR